MRTGRTLPPAAAPVEWRNLRDGVIALVSSARWIRALEEEIRQYFDVRDVFLVSSGTAALTMTLMALRSLSHKTVVIIPAYTCFSVPAAVVKAGLQPVPCDIDPTTFDYDPELLERALSRATLCVVAHHLFGIPSNIDRLRTACRAHGAFVVEDAAQAMGVRADGGWLGTRGDVGIFSFGRGKNITCGSGGVVVTNSERVARALERQYRRLPAPKPIEQLKTLLELTIMSMFTWPRLYWIPAAMPFLRLGETIFPKDIPLARLSGMKAGALRGWQRRLSRSNRIRSCNARYFSRRLGLASRPFHPYLRLPVLLSNSGAKSELHSRSKAHGFGLSAGYPRPVNEIPEVRAVCDGRLFPIARRVSETLLTIPTHQWLSEKDRRAIATCVAPFLAATSNRRKPAAAAGPTPTADVA